MADFEFPIHWMISRIGSHHSVSDLSKISDQVIRVERRDGPSITITPVTTDWLLPGHVDKILDTKEVDIICLINSASHYSWEARERAVQRNSTVHTMYELKASLPDEDPKIYRNRGVAKVQEIVGSHHRVEKARMLCESAILVKRTEGLGDIKFSIERAYEFSQEAAISALKRHPGVNAIVNGNINGRFTRAALELARENGVGLFDLSRLMGALNFETTTFGSYRRSSG